MIRSSNFVCAVRAFSSINARTTRMRPSCCRLASTSGASGKSKCRKVGGGWLTDMTKPTKDDVEAVARAITATYHLVSRLGGTELNQDFWRNLARAVLEHFARPAMPEWNALTQRQTTAVIQAMSDS